MHYLLQKENYKKARNKNRNIKQNGNANLKKFYLESSIFLYFQSITACKGNHCTPSFKIDKTNVDDINKNYAAALERGIIWGPVKHLRWESFAYKAVRYFRKKVPS